MIGSLARAMRDRLVPTMRRSEGVDLEARDKETLYAIFEAATGHSGFSPHRFLRFVDERVELHGEMKAAVALVDDASGKRFKGLAFATLTSDSRSMVFEKLFRRYPYRANESGLRNRLGFTARNLDLLRAKRPVKAFRQFVVREFLAFYYDEPEGWKAAGYEKARGHALEEASNGEVVAVRPQGGQVLLELSDGTFEEFDASMLEAGEPGWMVVKGGRQKAAVGEEILAELTAMEIGQKVPKTPKRKRKEGGHA